MSLSSSNPSASAVESSFYTSDIVDIATDTVSFTGLAHVVEPVVRPFASVFIDGRTSDGDAVPEIVMFPNATPEKWVSLIIFQGNHSRQ